MPTVTATKPIALLLRLLALLVLALTPVSAWAHPVPFSYMDLKLQPDGIDGTLVVHSYDLAHELKVPQPAMLLDHDIVEGRQSEMTALLAPRIHIGNWRARDIEWGIAVPLAERKSILFPFHLSGKVPGKLTVSGEVMPYDPTHQTFVNIFDGGKLRQQWIISKGSAPKTYYRGDTAGVLAVMGTFIPAGIHHIWIGPDHMLFLFGLLLLGGSLWRLTKIITAFTIGHSITLSLAALDIVTVPSSIVEPAIALTIVVVGADNLLQGQGRDMRFWLALCFGLIHGFGFASVLKEFGLPQSALGWSLFSFNIGVELGQLSLVVPVGLALAALRRYSPKWRDRVTIGGSIVVIGGGTWWFVQRVFLTGVG